MGLRAAAFLTAGIARVPAGTFVAADAGAAAVGVPLTFGVAYFFTDRLDEALADVHRIERWLGLVAGLAIVVVAIAAWRRYRRRLGVDEPSA
jgi:membrane protein DedA with SNARE-associated domain